MNHPKGALAFELVVKCGGYEMTWDAFEGAAFGVVTFSSYYHAALATVLRNKRAITSELIATLSWPSQRRWR